MKNLILINLFIFCLGVSLAQAQTRSISGVVTDIAGESIPGVNVIIKGTSIGAVTDLDGKYSVSDVSNAAVLQFSFIGYATQEISVGNQITINIQLVADIMEFEEFVVVGYGTQSKKDLSSAITVVETKELTRNPSVNVAQALQGQAAGVMVSSYGGSPGASAKINIRGIGSPNSTDPLYVIDGVPTGSSSTISPNDIESIQILKDGASTAIYGSRGANGVIIITTKSGVKGKAKFTFNAYQGVQKVWKTIDLLNANQYAELISEAAVNASSIFVPINPPARVTDAIENPELYGEGTDWQDAIFQLAPMQRYDINVSGGTEDLKYNASMGYFKQDGTIINTDYEQYTARIKTNIIKDKLEFGQSLSGSYSTRNGAVSQGGRSMLQLAVTSTPTLAVTDSLGNYQGAEVADGINIWNPVAWSAYNENRRRSVDFLGNAFAQYTIIPDLKLKYNFGLIGSADQDLRVIDAYNLGDFFENTDKDLTEEYSFNFRFVHELTLNYRKVMGNHSINALIGYTRERRTKNEIGVTVQGFPADFMESIGTGQELMSKSGTPSESRMESFLGRVQYSFNSRYYFTANIRRDGSSVFDQNYLFGNFPSVSLAWRLNEEGFLYDFKQINNLKLRLSYGEVGNAPIGNYGYQTRLNSGVNYTFGGDIAMGTVQTRYPSVGAKWETTLTKNIGVDLDMFDNRFSLVADAFIKETNDILIQVPIPYSAANHKSPPALNAGSVENKGFELSLSHNNTIGEFSYNLSGNLTYVVNEVTETSANKNVIIDGYTELGNVTRMEVGFPIGYFKGYEMLGIYKTQEEIDAVKAEYPSLVKNLKPGDIIYKDQDSNGSLNADDMVMIGNPFPDFIYGLKAGFDYKGVDFSLFFQGIKGNQIFNEMRHWTQNMSLTGNQSIETLNRWKPDAEDGNIFATLPRAELDRTTNQKLSDRYVEDGDYLRLKNVTLGYTFPESIINQIGVSNLRVYAQSQNLFTWTKYSMFDPEISPGGNLSTGIDSGTYPVPRIFTIGVQLSF